MPKPSSPTGATTRPRSCHHRPRVATAVIPPRRHWKQPRSYDRTLYKQRNLIECCFNRLKQFCRFSTRCCRTIQAFRFCTLSPALGSDFSYLSIPSCVSVHALKLGSVDSCRQQNSRTGFAFATAQQNRQSFRLGFRRRRLPSSIGWLTISHPRGYKFVRHCA
jgi:hypothetical protein